MGDALKYWDFFPTSEPDAWGRIPVWGYAEVIASTNDDVAAGTRVYGYLPTSTHLVVTPGRVDPRGFVDTAPHRASLPGAYNGYRRVDTDASEDPAYEDHRMVLWPLFFTSFLIDDFLDDNAFFGAQAVVVSSASSKTAIGTAFLLQHRPPIEVDRSDLGAQRRVRRRARRVRPSRRRTTTSTDWEQSEPRSSTSPATRTYAPPCTTPTATGWPTACWSAPPTGTCLGRRPPSSPAPRRPSSSRRIRSCKRTKEWGRAGLDDRAIDAWRRFAEFSDDWVQIQHGSGPDAVQSAYLELVDGPQRPCRRPRPLAVAGTGASYPRVFSGWRPSTWPMNGGWML